MVTSVAPIFAVAKNTVNQSGTLVAQMPTLSPLPMPMARKPLAMAFTRSSNCL